MLPGAPRDRRFVTALRVFAVAAACWLAPAAGGAERLVLYFNEDNPRVAAALAKLRAAIAERSVEPRHSIRIEHVAIDFSDQRGIRDALRVARTRNPAALVASSALVAQLAQEEGITTPIVFATHQDPVRLGLADSLRRPGGTMTGFMLYRSDEGKRLELLREIAPRARRIGVVIDEWWDRAPNDQYPSAAVLRRIAYENFGMEIEYFQADTLAALQALLAQPRARAMDAWYIPPTRIGFDDPEAVTRAITSLRRPAIYSLSLHAQSGGVISYQTVFEDPFATWAKMLALIFDGFPPGEIPVERPQTYQLAVNVKAARDQGIVIPKSILLRATHFY